MLSIGQAVEFVDTVVVFVEVELLQHHVAAFNTCEEGKRAWAPRRGKVQVGVHYGVVVECVVRLIEFSVSKYEGDYAQSR